MKYVVLLYYKYVAVAEPEVEREAQRELCSSLGLKGRILIGQEGINGTVAGSREATSKYIAAMNDHPLFGGISYKLDTTPDMPFPRLRVKSRPEVVTLEAEVDMSQTAPRLSPSEFDRLIQDPDVVIFDARNNYESAIGKFKGAITPDINLFKELPAALGQYRDIKDKTIVTYCTGGIRCEKASALMRQQGFKDVYQLDGGIINYAQTNPGGAFQGDCFVFDERMKVSFKADPELLGECLHCGTPTNDYYNCAYKPCNKLILVCRGCLPAKQTCGSACRDQITGVPANS